ncbi:MAG: UDP-3-O-acyl-N-acetylglucosamine deacetylase [Pannonibacter sp.]
MTHRTDFQTTLADQVTLTGVGVHSGKPASVTLLPADAGTGIVFTRCDAQDSARAIPARWDQVTATALCTVIADPARNGVSTVEHLMAALIALGVDNVVVEMDGPEMPIMDGSSAPFVEAIDQVGLKRLDRGRRYLRIKKPVRIDSGSAWCELLPYDGTRFEVTIEFDGALIGRQTFARDLTPDVFRKELSRARTFGQVRDVEKLWAMGFALGSSLENSVAIADDRVLNPEGTRWPDEFVRHKALDAVGDLALAGLPILGIYRSFKGGHKMNHAILEELFTRAPKDSFEIVEAPVWRDNSQAAGRPALAAAAFGPDVS